MTLPANHQAASTMPIDLPNKAYLLPDSIPMWPPVWWSWLILAMVISGTGLFLWYVIHRYQKNAYRREAMRTLKQGLNVTSDKELITLCHELIRRCLVTGQAYPLAAKPSHELFLILDKEMPKTLTFGLLGDVFITGAYQAKLTLSDQQRQTIIKTTQHWIRKHHA